MYRRVKFRWLKHIDFIILDMIWLVLADMATFYVRRLKVSSLFSDPTYRAQLLSLLAIDALVVISLSNFKNVLKRGYLIEFFKTIENAVALAAFETFFFFLTKTSQNYSRLAFGYFIIFYAVLSYAGRILLKKYLTKFAIPKSGASLLIICSGKEVPRVNEIFSNGALNTYRIAGLALADADDVPAAEPLIPIVSKGNANRDWIRQNWVDEVLLLMPPGELRDEMANYLLPMGVTVHIGIQSISGLEASKRYVQTIGYTDVVTFCWNSTNTLQMAFKRTVDIIGGLVGCVFTLLLTIIVGPMIYIASPGPIFFTQKRVGRNGKIFKMYKFRSMYTDAEERKKEFMAQNRIADGMMFKLDFDPRIIGNKELADGTRRTGLGEFIRKTSIDEFPQFFNVLKGDMSLVGTRPPTLDEWEKYKDYHRARLSMKPGITGLWQVSGRSNITDFDEIVRLDTHYIANFSFREDLRILLRTVLVVLKHEGSM